MHFHLPKPLHGCREFAGEVGIIFLGVLIALGAEQLVETIHWRHQVRAEREALDNDVQGMWAAMSGRQIIQACVDRRLGDLALVFARHEQGKPLGIIAPIGRPGVWTGETSALQMASADGTLAHMSFEEKNRYFGVQSSYETFEPAAYEERDSWRVLQALDDPGGIDQQDWHDLRKAYRDAVDSNRIMKADLVTGPEGAWFNPFVGIKGLHPNKGALTLWMVRALCAPAVKP